MTAAGPGPVLVTGATGFAGGHLLQHLAPARDVVAWGRSEPPSEVAPLATWARVDLLDRDAVRRAIDALRPAAVFHLAGVPSVAASWDDTASPLAGHVLATAHLLDALVRTGRPSRVLVTGSAAVYAPSDTPIPESGAVAPTSPYALSKLAQEQLSLRAGPEDGLDVIVARAFNHTGPRQSAAFVAPSFARQIARIEHGQQDPVLHVGDLTAVRDLTDVRDVVGAYALLMDTGAPGTVYNIGSGVGRAIGSILEALVSRARVPVRVETDPARLRPRDVRALVADCARLVDATGWSPRVSFDQMLDDLLAYWRAEVRKPG